eukprot:SM000079S22437  [mRNA]  locus=s79:229959:232088:+ [translate_table: standard]
MMSFMLEKQLQKISPAAQAGGAVQMLARLREETAAMPGGQMQVSPEQGQLLAMLVRLTGAQRCIEVGVFTGYSSISMALALPAHGKLVASDRVPYTTSIAQKYFELAGVSHKVDVRLGAAVDTLTDLLNEGEEGRFDMAFLDADKRSYGRYYELLLKLLRPGGLLVVDNVLWYGSVADPSVMDEKTKYLREFNKFLLTDSRVSISLIPVGDGMTLCRKEMP